MELHLGPVHVMISTSSKSIEVKKQKKCLHEAALQVSGVFQRFCRLHNEAAVPCMAGGPTL